MRECCIKLNNAEITFMRLEHVSTHVCGHVCMCLMKCAQPNRLNPRPLDCCVFVSQKYSWH